MNKHIMDYHPGDMITNEKSSILVRKIIPKYREGRTGLEYECKRCGYIGVRVRLYEDKELCQYCSNEAKDNKSRSVYNTRPDLVKYFKNPEEAKNITIGSNRKVDCICPFCGHEKMISPNVLQKQGLGCKYCSDSISYPNKFMRALLNQINIEYEPEMIFEWLKDRKYDFYFPSLNLIVEMHGLQHYAGWGDKKEDLEEQIINDKYKEEMALNNGIKTYITIDSRWSDPYFIRKNIEESNLTKLLPLDNVNWESVYIEAEKSYLIRSCELYDKGYYPKTIANELEISKSSVNNYLRRGKDLGLCNYIPNSRRSPDSTEKGKAVVLLEENRMFLSIGLASKETGIARRQIQKCCDRILPCTTGKYRDNITHWLYLDEEIFMTSDEIEKVKKQRPVPYNRKPVKCIQTGQIFEKMEDAARWCNMSKSNFNKFFKGEQLYAGYHPETREPLTWELVTNTVKN